MHANDAISPADSSTEGDSSHQSQRSIVYLHAATGNIILYNMINLYL